MDLSPTVALLVDAIPIGVLLAVLFALRARRAGQPGGVAEAAEHDRGLRSWERLPRSTERRVTAVDPSALGGERRPGAKDDKPK